MSKYLDENGLTYLWSKIKGTFVAQVSGKGLSTNDYTTAEKNKLAGLSNYTHPTYTAKTNGLYKITIDGTGHVSSAVNVSKSDITALGIPSQDTTYSDMTGATATADGTHGLVPKPSKGDQSKFLRADGTWSITSDTTYNLATTTSNGLMSSTDKKKLDGFLSASSYALKTDLTGLYKYKGSIATASLPTTGQVKGDVYNLTDASEYGVAGTNVAWTGEDWDALGGLFVINSLSNSDIDSICK